MSKKSGRNGFVGHGRVICEKCGDIIITCKCFKCEGNTLYDICDSCALSLEKENPILLRGVK